MRRFPALSMPALCLAGGVVLLSTSSAHAAEAPDGTTAQRGATTRPGRSRRGGALVRYLGREVAHGPRYLDHGVLAVGVAGGLPHLYRLELGLGVLDHLSAGVTAHWLPRQTAPRWSPRIAVALYRGRLLEVGATYHRSLHPAPTVDNDPDTPGFEQSTHWFLGAVTFSQAWLSAGFDLGMARAREDDELNEDDTVFVVRNRLAGGVHLRVGTRRIGLSLGALAPYFAFDAVLDVRFGLFEERPAGHWLEG